jgi:hypothetical protein
MLTSNAILSLFSLFCAGLVAYLEQKRKNAVQRSKIAFLQAPSLLVNLTNLHSLLFANISIN